MRACSEPEVSYRLPGNIQPVWRMEFDRIPIRGFHFQDHKVASGDVSVAQDDALCCPAIKSVYYPCISQQFFQAILYGIKIEDIIQFSDGYFTYPFPFTAT